MGMQWRETQGKQLHDPFIIKMVGPSIKYCPGPIVVGAGPSGLAVAACLKEKGIPSTVMERANCIGSLWQHRTYDRLRLHLPKNFCELPMMPFPEDFPTYPTKHQFLSYLEAYAKEFEIRPMYNQSVESAEFDAGIGMWRVMVKNGAAPAAERRREYVGRWLVVATGENAEAVVPEIEGMEEFQGQMMHTSSYRRGDAFAGKKVLVVGCGNSGMEVCLDLCNHNARPTMVVRDSVHVLPQEILGRSTFGLSMSLLSWLPLQTVDRLLLFLSWLIMGDTAKLGIRRPELGPLELKSISGKTPVLDAGTLAKIKSGDIKVYPGIERLSRHGAEFVDGRLKDFDALILATGYRSNVPSWLKEKEFFSEKDGMPRRWKGERGLYAVGFTRRGLFGAGMDARKIADDIEQCFQVEANRFMVLSCTPN